MEVFLGGGGVDDVMGGGGVVELVFGVVIGVFDVDGVGGLLVVLEVELGGVLLLLFCFCWRVFLCWVSFGFINVVLVIEVVDSFKMNS